MKVLNLLDEDDWSMYCTLGETTINTLKPREMTAILQTTLSNAFSWIKMNEFWFNFHWSLFKGPIEQYSSIDSDNDLAPARWHAIVWTIAGYFADAYMRYSDQRGRTWIWHRKWNILWKNIVTFMELEHKVIYCYFLNIKCRYIHIL